MPPGSFANAPQSAPRSGTAGGFAACAGAAAARSATTRTATIEARRIQKPSMCLTWGAGAWDPFEHHARRHRVYVRILTRGCKHVEENPKGTCKNRESPSRGRVEARG